MDFFHWCWRVTKSFETGQWCYQSTWVREAPSSPHPPLHCQETALYVTQKDLRASGPPGAQIEVPMVGSSLLTRRSSTVLKRQCRRGRRVGNTGSGSRDLPQRQENTCVRAQDPKWPRAEDCVCVNCCVKQVDMRKDPVLVSDLLKEQGEEIQFNLK